MPLSQNSWKEVGCDTSPPRPEPGPLAKAEMEAGRRQALMNKWIEDGKVVYLVVRDQYKVGDQFFDKCPLDDLLIARIALALEAGAWR